MSNPLKVAVLISGRGSNMQALVNASREAGYPAQIAVVLSNDPTAQGLEWAAAQGLPTAVVNHRDFGKDRESFERAVDAEIKKYGCQLVCLAGWMRLLTPWFVGEWLDRLVNIHPSLLPAFPGLHVQQAAIDYGAKFSGCTVHFVRAEMDHGPIIIQAAVPVLPDDTEDTLAARILECEHKAYPQAVCWIAQARVNVIGEKVLVTGTHNPDAVMNPVG
ncbi:MAG: phosphoribosylglycinamide formyltransferase [Alphaproteobacteria bacterium]|nr:phosphoribosylglycinamide formyltransferase [Alphaproteobacteria bacterium]